MEEWRTGLFVLPELADEVVVTVEDALLDAEDGLLLLDELSLCSDELSSCVKTDELLNSGFLLQPTKTQRAKTTAKANAKILKYLFIILNYILSGTVIPNIVSALWITVLTATQSAILACIRGSFSGSFTRFAL